MAEKPEPKIYEDPQEAVNDLQEALNKAFPEGRWMVAIWCVEGPENDKKVSYKGKWTWKFPHADYFKAAFWFMKDLFDELTGLDEQKPKLQLAAFLGAGDAPPPASTSEASGDNGPPPLSQMQEGTERVPASDVAVEEVPPTDEPAADDEDDW